MSDLDDKVCLELAAKILTAAMRAPDFPILDAEAVASYFKTVYLAIHEARNQRPMPPDITKGLDEARQRLEAYEATREAPV